MLGEQQVAAVLHIVGKSADHVGADKLRRQILPSLGYAYTVYLHPYLTILVGVTVPDAMSAGVSTAPSA